MSSRFTAETTISLHRVLIRPFGDDRAYVYRWGGRSFMATRSLGVQAIRLLQRYRNLGHVGRLLQMHDQQSRVNLSHLVSSLEKAHLLASIDDRRLQSEKITLASVASFLLRFYFLPAIRKIVTRVLDFERAAQALFYMNACGTSFSLRLNLARCYLHMRNVFPTANKFECRSMLNGYISKILKQRIDLDLMMMMGHARSARWLHRNIRVCGLSHLAKTVDTGAGVILATFHFNGHRLIPMILMMQGYAVTVVGPPKMSIGFTRTVAWYQELGKVLGRGNFELIPDFSVEDISKILAALRSGKIVLCYPDTYPFSSSKRERELERSRFFGVWRLPFPRSRTNFEIGRYTAQVSPWIGWLAATSRAPVLVAALLRKSNCEAFCLEIDPLLPSGDSEACPRSRVSKSAFTKLVFSRWKRLLDAHPEEWYGWHGLHKWGLSLSPSADTSHVIRPVSVPSLVR